MLSKSIFNDIEYLLKNWGQDLRGLQYKNLGGLSPHPGNIEMIRHRLQKSHRVLLEKLYECLRTIKRKNVVLKTFEVCFEGRDERVAQPFGATQGYASRGTPSLIPVGKFYHGIAKQANRVGVNDRHAQYDWASTREIFILG